LKIELDLSSPESVVELVKKLQEMYESNKEVVGPLLANMTALWANIAAGNSAQVESMLAEYDLAAQVVSATEGLESLRERSALIENVTLTAAKIAKLLIKAALA